LYFLFLCVIVTSQHLAGQTGLSFFLIFQGLELTGIDTVVSSNIFSGATTLTTIELRQASGVTIINNFIGFDRSMSPIVTSVVAVITIYNPHIATPGFILTAAIYETRRVDKVFMPIITSQPISLSCPTTSVTFSIFRSLPCFCLLIRSPRLDQRVAAVDVQCHYAVSSQSLNDLLASSSKSS